MSEDGTQKGRKTEKDQDQLETAGVLQPAEDGQSVEINGSFDDLLRVRDPLLHLQICQRIFLGLADGGDLMISPNEETLMWQAMYVQQPLPRV